MASGPQRARLDQGLTGAQENAVSDSALEWNRCNSILSQISMALATASPQVKEKIGGRTGPAVDAAFARSSRGMAAKGAELVKGSQALQAAADAIAEARTEQAYLRAHPLQEPRRYTREPGPQTDADIQREAAARQAQRDYQAAYADQEARAKAKADHMDRVFARSTATMKEIHGIPDEPPPGGGPSDGGSGSRGGTTPVRPTTTSSDGTHQTIHSTSTTHYDPHNHATTSDPGQDNPGHHYVPGGGDGAPQGGGTVDYRPAGPGQLATPVGTTAGGLTPTTGLGLAGAVAGGIGGGLLGTGLATGGRAGLTTPVVTSPGTAASGVRGIGATSRAGVSGALGRPGGLVTGTTPGAASRGSTARGGAAVSGRGAGAGARGAAGGRGSSAGSTAGGRSGRRKKDEKGRRRELFDAAEEWVDDEDAAPGVID